ncbi:DJ-1/PfpI family protein [Mycoplasmoides pirum]|uniref:DJ-1/PfpI family protein n=1 Tax=Mycoplasmoides pirum TaxID=2122 RepID=UPI0004801703|nr:DJ-1/PfpI family protein [Mycoplasmoides pirum]
MENKSKNNVKAKPLKKQIRIAAMVATGIEDMELIVPVDIWRRSHFVVDLISIEKKNSVLLQRGVSIKCTQTIDKTNLKQYNAIFLPGGKGYEKFLLEPKLIEHLNKFNETKKWLLGICSSPIVFSELKLLGSAKVACFPEDAKKIKDNYSKEPIVVSQNFITAMSAGHVFDFALQVVQTLASKSDATEVAKSIYYNKKGK